MQTTGGVHDGALVAWTKGRPHFTAAGLRHYEAACAEVHLAFLPHAIRSAKDLCRFLRSLLQASVQTRQEQAEHSPGSASNDASTSSSRASLQQLAQRALGEVAQASSDAADRHQYAAASKARYEHEASMGERHERAAE